MPPFDPYAILGLNRQATPEQIRQAYRELARRYHPDLNKSEGAEERFKELAQAYSILNDEKRRARYDATGEVGCEAETHAKPPPVPQEPPSPDGFPRGGRARRRDVRSAAGRRSARPERGPASSRDIVVPLELDLVATIAGGLVRTASPLGKEMLSVDVPPGAHDGDLICLQGYGRPTPGGGRNGDLYFEVRVRPHPFFHREGNDLILELPVTVEEVCRGARVQIPTPDGWVKVRIPAGSRGGERLRLRGQGMVGYGGKDRGDLYVHLCVRLPEQLATAGPTIARLTTLYTGPVRTGLHL